MNTAELGCWHFESDGDIGRRTFYAYRDNAAQPCGVERIDFKSAKEARTFVSKSNALIFSILNKEE